MRQLSVTIAIPTYNGSGWIKACLKSILSQSFKNYQINISDDRSTDDTIEVIKKIKDKRIQIHKNKVNVGYAKNLQIIKKFVKTDILFLMGQDDILLPGALQKTYDMFVKYPDVGVVTRPYYWFDRKMNTPVRVVLPYDQKQDSIISVLDGERETKKIFESVGQLSGLAFRMKYFEGNFHDETFPSHIYPFAYITKKYKVAYLKNYTIAVRIESSQTRFVRSIYDISPTLSWVTMFRTVYKERKYKIARNAGIEQMATNFVGLVQLKNYSTFSNLIREIMIMIQLRPLNLITPQFWFFALGTIIIPRSILIWMVDNFKRKVISRQLKNKVHVNRARDN